MGWGRGEGRLGTKANQLLPCTLSSLSTSPPVPKSSSFTMEQAAGTALQGAKGLSREGGTFQAFFMSSQSEEPSSAGGKGISSEGIKAVGESSGSRGQGTGQWGRGAGLKGAGEGNQPDKST